MSRSAVQSNVLPVLLVVLTKVSIAITVAHTPNISVSIFISAHAIFCDGNSRWVSRTARLICRVCVQWNAEVKLILSLTDFQFIHQSSQ